MASKLLLPLSLLSSLFVTDKLTVNPDPRIGLNTEEMIKYYGYYADTHSVTTEDGYILKIQNIPYGNYNKNKTLFNLNVKPTILLVHGMFSAGLSWVELGPKYSLGFILSDFGFDVWIGNHRGTKESNKHIKLDQKRDAKKFWDFSFHEIGIYDLPAIIDYIIKYRNLEKIYFLGISEGTTDFFVMGSDRSEYNEKIKLALLLAPAAYYTNYHKENENLYEMVKYKNTIENFLYTLGIYYFDSEILHVICKWSYFIPLCYKLLAMNNVGPPDKNDLSLVFANNPAPASVKEVLHYCQASIGSDIIKHFDYGVENNMKKYGQTIPPPYNLKKVTAPCILYEGENDTIVYFNDAELVRHQLPNVIKSHKIHSFSHYDFIYGDNAVNSVYSLIVRDLYEDLFDTMKKRIGKT